MDFATATTQPAADSVESDCNPTQARPGGARLGKAWHGTAGQARLGAARHGGARQAGRGAARLGKVWQARHKPQR